MVESVTVRLHRTLLATMVVHRLFEPNGYLDSQTTESQYYPESPGLRVESLHASGLETGDSGSELDRSPSPAAVSMMGEDITMLSAYTLSGAPLLSSPVCFLADV